MVLLLGGRAQRGDGVVEHTARMGGRMLRAAGGDDRDKRGEVVASSLGRPRVAGGAMVPRGGGDGT